MKLKIFIMVLSLLTAVGYADDIGKMIESQSISKEFLIVKSTPDYKEALRYAKKVAKLTGIKYDSRGLHEHKKIKLTFSKDECENREFGYPCYIARGRYDDGVYVSVEHSDYYKGFAEGFYIVVVASGNELKGSLKQVRNVVKDAYVKRSEVYMGCMH